MHVTRQTTINSGIFCLVMTLAVLLRVYDFPSRYEHRDMDETGYCAGCLQLLEGISPGYKAAPAGPLFWAGWAWTGGETIYDLAHPLPAESQVSKAVRPLVALNRTLFDNYRDLSSLHRFLVIMNISISLLAAMAAVGLGIRYAGTIGGLLLGGLVAGVPVFLSLSEMSRPYSMAWSFGLIALYFAAGNAPLRQRRRWMMTAVFLGLSIASRIEMLCLLPIVWWIIWDRPGSSRYLVVIAKITLLGAVVATWAAPWLMTHLIGNLRAIATVRFGKPPGGGTPWETAFFDLMVGQGMIVVTLMALIGLALQPAGARLRRACLGAYAMVLLFSMLSGFAWGIHQHGAVFIVWFVLMVVTLQSMQARWGWMVWPAVLAALSLPILQSIHNVRVNRDADDREDSVAWIEQHVPAGTTVYLLDGGMRTLLPTTASGDSLWDEVNDPQAWRKKVASGLKRFDLKADELPRALGEENLIQERGNRRKWFILAGRTDLAIPRYDVRIVYSSPVFGIPINEFSAALKAHGGVVVWRDEYDLPPPDVGAPAAEWLNGFGKGVRVYCTPDVHLGLVGRKID